MSVPQRVRTSTKPRLPITRAFTARRRAIAAIAIAALSAALSSSAPARAQGPSGDASTNEADAAARFKRGVELFKEADFRAALVEFRRAYQIDPNFRVLYNIGQCALELQDYAGALRAFDQYLSLGGQEIPAARRSAVEQEIQKLRARVATVDVRTNVTGAEIRVDDEVVGTSPLAQPIVVSAGRRRIVVEKPGTPPAAKVIDVAGNDRLAVTLNVSDAARAPSAGGASATQTAPSAPNAPNAGGAHASPAAPPPPEPSSKTWIGWTATGVLAAASVATGVLALRAKSDLDAKLGAMPGDRAGIDDAHSRMRTFALVADITGAAAIVAGGVTLYFTLTSHGKEERAAAASRVRVGVAPDRVLLQGTF